MIGILNCTETALKLCLKLFLKRRITLHVYPAIK